MLRVTFLSILRLVSRPPTPPDKKLAACDSVTRALLPACVRVTERQPPRCISLIDREAKTYTHHQLEIKNEQDTCRHHSPPTHAFPIVPLNPSCALPALAQPLSIFSILVPENPCSKRVLTEVYGRQQQQHERY